MTATEYLTESRRSLERLRQEARDLLTGLEESDLNRPCSAGWTVGEILDHLVVTADPYLDKMEELASSGPPRTVKAYRHTWIGKTLLRASGPNGNAPAPKALWPRPGPHRQDLIDRYLHTFERLERVIDSAADVDLSRAKMGSPIAPVLRMNLGDAIGILLGHAERHQNQIAERLQRR